MRWEETVELVFEDESSGGSLSDRGGLWMRAKDLRQGRLLTRRGSLQLMEYVRKWTSVGDLEFGVHRPGGDQFQRGIVAHARA